MLEVYGSLGIVAGIAQVAYLATAFALGARLLTRARRADDAPHALLGAHLLLAMGVGYLLLSIAYVAVQHMAAPPRGLVAIAVATGYLATMLGLGATLAFNVLVFRPGSRPARLAAWGLFGVMACGWVGYGWTGGFPMARFEGPWLWTLMLGVVTSNLWIALEPLLQYRMARRRVRLGLADPLVANRFLLWGFGSLARTAMATLGPLAARWLEGTDPAASATPTAVVLAATSGLGLFASLAYWLTFSPSRFYVRWVRGGSASGSG